MDDGNLAFKSKTRRGNVTRIPDESVPEQSEKVRVGALTKTSGITEGTVVAIEISLRMKPLVTKRFRRLLAAVYGNRV